MRRLPFSAYIGAIICIPGEVLVLVSLFMVYITVPGSSPTGRAGGSWIADLIITIGQPPSPLFIVLAVLAPASVLVPLITSVFMLFSKRNLFFSIISGILAMAGLLLSLGALAMSLPRAQAITHSVLSPSLEGGAGLLSLGLLIAVVGAFLQTRRVSSGEAAPAFARQVEPIGSFRNNQSKQAQQKYSYFADKASKQP